VKYLLDTHTLLWWLFEQSRLSPRADAVLRGGANTLLWSAVGTWECAIKARAGKLKLPYPVSEFFPRVIAEEALVALPVTHAHAAAVADLPDHHRDPFDRLLVAQAMIEGAVLVSCDPSIRLYGVEVVW
jgi:PIN domain nuclease of toxin-antitoxin system